jgi:hypothetical protein
MDYLSLCLICKDENDYLPEWLDYHILMGVERFYIYDNESQVSLRESLADYIELGWVIVMDIQGRGMQLHAYDHCLQTFGAQTKWMGFIDTDEFLVPKTSLDLKELLREYEAYGGLAVSSLFFGSSGHKIRPNEGQIAGYTKSINVAFKEFELVKSIVRPDVVFLPNSPHDFLYKEGTWCVNEKQLRVDGQRFPSNTQKIQLNHYYCRSEEEIDRKLERGRGDRGGSWPRRRFNVANKLAVYENTDIFESLQAVFSQVSFATKTIQNQFAMLSLTEKLSFLSKRLNPTKLLFQHQSSAQDFRGILSEVQICKAKIASNLETDNLECVKKDMLLLLQITPNNINLYVDLAVILLDLHDDIGAWQLLIQAWQLSSNNNYCVLGAMVYFFLRTKNFKMAESTCRLLLDIAPHDLQTMGFLAETLLGQDRFEEGLRVGVPVIEYSAMLGELPEGMGVFLIKKMADYLVDKKDYMEAKRLWQEGVKCQPGDVNVLLELSRVLLLDGDIVGAQEQLAKANLLEPKNEGVLAMLKQVTVAPVVSKKRRH